MAAMLARAVIVFLLILLQSSFLSADEGMWTFNNFPSDGVAKKYGFKPDSRWLEHVRLSSARIAGGCSSSFVSPNGLVMTNHHCAASCIQDISTSQHNYTAQGFYAKSGAEEVKCPNMELNQLLQISDVTQRVNGATRGLSGQQFNDALNKEKASITKACATSDDYLCEVVTLYSGSRYDLYKYRRFPDVRIVFAPEKDIAFFGGDPDNFNFPRYDLDVTFLRAYDDGHPAKTENYFKWSREGAKDNMLTFVIGNPGTTDRERTISELEYMRDYELPDYLIQMSEYRGLLTQFQTRGKEQARISNSLLFGVENSIKARRGEYEALVDKVAFSRHTQSELEFRKKVESTPELKNQFGGAWDAIARATARERIVAPRYTDIERGRAFRSRFYGLARQLVRGTEEIPKPNEVRLPEYADAKLPQFRAALFTTAPIYPELEIETLTFSLTKMREDLGPDDPLVHDLLGKRSPREVATDLITNTKLSDVAFRKQLLDGGKSAVETVSDPMIQFACKVDKHARQIRAEYERDVEGVQKKNHELLGRARFAVYGNSIYPDATFTPRVSYGSVRGWVENGKQINPITIIGGVYERNTGSDPFALPQSWLRAKDKLDLTTPFNFVTTNDIIGGNSGSPMINQNAEIIGLIFDGNIWSLGGEFWFDESVNRSVAVHSRVVTEALDKVYGARRVLEEIKPAGE